MSQALERSEGCWAWVVLLASVVTQGLTLGFPTCIGIFFTELQREFQASNSETSWFPSILTAMLHAGGEQGGEGDREVQENSLLGTCLLPSRLCSCVLCECGLCESGLCECVLCEECPLLVCPL